MEVIVAAGSAGQRSRLQEAARSTGAAVVALAGDADALASALRASPEALVLTGGDARELAPFWRTVRRLQAPSVVVSDARHPAAPEGAPFGWLGEGAGPGLLRVTLEAVAGGLQVTQAGGGALPLLRPGSVRLSPREREVLERVAAGLSTKAIARQLALSPNTVKFHLRELFAKLGASTRSGAVVEAMRRGELTL